MTKKSPIQKFISELKQMHPVYAMYMMQRIQADLELIREHLPAEFEKEKNMDKENIVSLIHPRFYAAYLNMMADILNDALDTNIEHFVEPSVFEDTEK